MYCHAVGGVHPRVARRAQVRRVGVAVHHAGRRAAPVAGPGPCRAFPAGYCDNHINSNPKQYGMQEQQQQQLLQKEFEEKEGSEYLVPSEVAMANEQQQQSGYGVLGAEQAASMTAGVSAYTDSISNSVSPSITTITITIYAVMCLF